MKTDELSGALLDYWVARAEGLPLCCDWNQGEYILVGTGKGDLEQFSPSTDWAEGGPLIERDHIFLNPPSEVHYNGGPNHGWHRYDYWRATVSSATRTLEPKNEFQKSMNVRPVGRGSGETPLIAAMRALVASHFGDEVPDETPYA